MGRSADRGVRSCRLRQRKALATFLDAARGERFSAGKLWRAGKTSLPDGKYLVKAYVDAEGKLAKDWKAVLGETDYAGQAEFQAKWKEGYGSMTAVDASKVRK